MSDKFDIINGKITMNGEFLGEMNKLEFDVNKCSPIIDISPTMRDLAKADVYARAQRKLKAILGLTDNGHLPSEYETTFFGSGDPWNNNPGNPIEDIMKAADEMLSNSRGVGPPTCLQIIPTKLMVKTEWYQYRFPKSKKKRIRKKWAKRQRNFRSRIVPDDHVIIEGDKLFAHPDIVDKIVESLEKGELIKTREQGNLRFSTDLGDSFLADNWKRV